MRSYYTLYLQAVIRPILEYAAQVWHHLLSKCQTDQIEAIQKRAVNIIFTCSYGMSYSSDLFLAGLTSLTTRREQYWRATCLTLLCNRDRAYITYCHLHGSCTSVTLKSYFKISSYS